MPQGYPGGPAPGQQPMPSYPGAPANPSMPGYGGGAPAGPAVPGINVRDYKCNHDPVYAVMNFTSVYICLFRADYFL